MRTCAFTHETLLCVWLELLVMSCKSRLISVYCCISKQGWVNQEGLLGRTIKCFQLLIEIWPDEKIQQQLDTCTRKTPVLEKIARRLEEEGGFCRSFFHTFKIVMLCSWGICACVCNTNPGSSQVCVYTRLWYFSVSTKSSRIVTCHYKNCQLVNTMQWETFRTTLKKQFETQAQKRLSGLWIVFSLSIYLKSEAVFVRSPRKL